MKTRNIFSNFKADLVTKDYYRPFIKALLLHDMGIWYALADIFAESLGGKNIPQTLEYIKIDHLSVCWVSIDEDYCTIILLHEEKYWIGFAHINKNVFSS